MKSEPAAPTQLFEPTSDRTPQPFGSGLPDPIVCDASARSLRQRTVNFAAKRMVDMLYVSGLDRETADRHFRWRPAAAPGDLASRPAAVANETDYPMDLAALNRVIATAIATLT
jgi:hypothetical protein